MGTRGESADHHPPTNTVITVIAAASCHQERHLLNNPPTVISNRDNISGQHRCYRTVLLRPTPSSPNPPWLQGPSSWSAVQTAPASVDARPGVRAVTSRPVRRSNLVHKPLCYPDGSLGLISELGVEQAARGGRGEAEGLMWLSLLRALVLLYGPGHQLRLTRHHNDLGGHPMLR